MPEIILYCVAATAQEDDNYYQHYVLGLQHVLAAQPTNPNLKHVFFVSSTRVYGQITHALLDEVTPAEANDFGGYRLLEAEQQLQIINCSSTVLQVVWYIWSRPFVFGQYGERQSALASAKSME